MTEKIIVGNMEVNEYKGEWSLIAVREWEGKFYWEMCKKVYGKNKTTSDKIIPMAVGLGPTQTAVGYLLEIIHAITGEWYEPKQKTHTMGDEVPF